MQWSPQLGPVVATAVAGVGLALSTLLVDPAGSVLLGAAAALLLGLAAHDAWLRPRLRADEDGVTVRRASGAVTVGWPALRVRVRTQRRWGLSSRTLELDDRTDDAVLLVLGRRELGADPEAVAAALLEAGGRHGS